MSDDNSERVVDGSVSFDFVCDEEGRFRVDGVLVSDVLFGVGSGFVDVVDDVERVVVDTGSVDDFGLWYGVGNEAVTLYKGVVTSLKSRSLVVASPRVCRGCTVRANLVRDGGVQHLRWRFGDIGESVDASDNGLYIPSTSAYDTTTSVIERKSGEDMNSYPGWNVNSSEYNLVFSVDNEGHISVTDGNQSYTGVCTFTDEELENMRFAFGTSSAKSSWKLVSLVYEYR